MALLGGGELHAGEHRQALAGGALHRRRGLLHGGDVARAVVVTDGDHVQALSDGHGDDHGRRHALRGAGRERRVHVQVCGAALHASVPFRPSPYSRPTTSNVPCGAENRARPSAAALSTHLLVGAAAAGEHHGGHLGVAGHGDHIEVHLQRDQHAAGGGVGQHVAEQVRGVAAGHLGVGRGVQGGELGSGRAPGRSGRAS